MFTLIYHAHVTMSFKKIKIFGFGSLFTQYFFHGIETLPSLKHFLKQMIIFICCVSVPRNHDCRIKILLAYTELHI
jgi:hypothetical protein